MTFVCTISGYILENIVELPLGYSSSLPFIKELNSDSFKLSELSCMKELYVFVEEIECI